MKGLRIIAVALFATVALQANGQNKPEENAMSWDELSAHQVPEWFQDAKFGIYAHLGVYCVPANTNEWYPRYMYINGHEVQKYHAENFGAIGEFEYHDFIPMFTIPEFKAAEWAELFYRAGAKFAGPVAEHHDGFSMWDSDVNRWNAKDMGPKRDVVGEMTKEIRKRGMKVITSFHHGFNIDGYYTTLEGTATADPEYADLYGKLPAKESYDRWLWKLEEVIDKYEPDQIWFDWGLRAIPLEYRRRFASYYYEKARQKNQEVIITRKLAQLPEGVGVKDYEGGSPSSLMPFVWQTDQSTGGHIWSWRDGIVIRSPKSILHELINVTSKNGVMLLNVCPNGKGEISDDQKELLYKMGDWLRVNGEAIYGTRPWRVSGEGPRFAGNYGYYHDHFCSAPQLSKQEVRYTQKDGNLYAICLSWPKDGFTFDKVLVKEEGKNAKVTLLGYGAVDYSVAGESLTIAPMPIEETDMELHEDDAYVLKIEGFKLEADPFSKSEKITLSGDNATVTGEIKYRRGGYKMADGTLAPNGADHWDNQEDKIYWMIDVKTPGEYIVRADIATRFRAAEMYLSNGSDKLLFSTIPDDTYGVSHPTNYGTIYFDKAGLHTIELGVRPMDDFPGIQRFWNIELAPLD